jgi:hypothetical protein
VDRQQAAAPQAGVDGVPGEAEREQLAPRDDAVLAVGEHRDRAI